MPRARSKGAKAVRIGLAGWSEAASRYGKLLPHAVDEGATGLQRYAAAFDFVEINSSFYRQVRPETYAKWAGEVHDEFRFSVKMHRLVTHYTRLKNTEVLEDFFASVSGLGDKLAVVLIQLPPTLVFEPERADIFFRSLRHIFNGGAVCEPRHASWLDDAAGKLFAAYGVGLVMTKIPAVGEDFSGLVESDIPLYLRLHGSPRGYYSSYSSEDLRRLADFLAGHEKRRRYVVFDNTAGPAGVRNALELQGLVR